MAPPAKTPRLSALDPQCLATETVEQLRDRLSRAAFYLSPAYQLAWHESGDGPLSTDLALTILDLCAWAQKSEGRADEALDAASTVAAVMYARPIDGADYEVTELSGDADPTTEIGLLLIASLARCRLTTGEALSTRDLGVLASLSTLQIRNLIRQGEIKAREKGGDYQILASEARRWLSGRGQAA